MGNAERGHERSRFRTRRRVEGGHRRSLQVTKGRSRRDGDFFAQGNCYEGSDGRAVKHTVKAQLSLLRGLSQESTARARRGSRNVRLGRG